MKRIAILSIPILATFLLSGNAISQQKPDRDCSMAVADTSVMYSYDAAGNRIKRRLNTTSAKAILLPTDSLTTKTDTLNIQD